VLEQGERDKGFPLGAEGEGNGPQKKRRRHGGWVGKAAAYQKGPLVERGTGCGPRALVSVVTRLC